MGDVSFRLIERLHGADAAEQAQQQYKQRLAECVMRELCFDVDPFDIDPTDMGREFNNADFYTRTPSRTQSTNATIGSGVITLATGPAWLAPEHNDRCPVTFVKTWGQTHPANTIQE